jgi:hypothetical protein
MPSLPRAGLFRPVPEIHKGHENPDAAKAHGREVVSTASPEDLGVVPLKKEAPPTLMRCREGR